MKKRLFFLFFVLFAVSITAPNSEAIWFRHFNDSFGYIDIIVDGNWSTGSSIEAGYNDAYSLNAGAMYSPTVPYRGMFNNYSKNVAPGFNFTWKVKTTSTYGADQYFGIMYNATDCGANWCSDGYALRMDSGWSSANWDIIKIQGGASTQLATGSASIADIGDGAWHTVSIFRDYYTGNISVWVDGDEDIISPSNTDIKEFEFLDFSIYNHPGAWIDNVEVWLNYVPFASGTPTGNISYSESRVGYDVNMNCNLTGHTIVYYLINNTIDNTYTEQTSDNYTIKDTDFLDSLVFYCGNSTTYFNTPIGNISNNTIDKEIQFNVTYPGFSTLTNMEVIFNENLYNYTQPPDTYVLLTEFLNMTTTEANVTMNITAFGFQDGTDNATLTEKTDYIHLNLTPVKLHIVFDSQTDGYVAWTDPVNGTDGFSFNATEIIIVQSNISLGYVSIVFNGGKQLYEYYNDLDTHIYQTLHVETPDLIQPVKLWDGIQMVEGKIEAYKLVNETFVKVFSTYTNKEGMAQILLVAGNTYKFVGSADGYVTTSQIEYIEPTSEEIATRTILLTLVEDTTPTESMSYQNDCPGKVNNVTICSITANSEVNTYTFFFNYTIGNVTGTQTNADSTSATLVLTITDSTDVDVFVDGVWENSFHIEYINLTNQSRVIGFTPEDRSWVLADKTTTIAFVIVMVLLSGVFALLIENKFEGWGIKAAVAFLVIGAGYVMPVFWAVGVIYVAWFVYNHYKEVGQ